MKKIYKLEPTLHANIWGGNKLRDYGKKSDADRIGESWELSFVKGDEALVDSIPVSVLFDRKSWGTNAQCFEDFPVLTKFIDAKEKLSVQVHPDDEYAKVHEGGYGKSEMWYVVDAEEGAGLYMGLKENTDKEAIRAAIADGTVENMLSFKKVKSGDVFFIPAGTIHAIGGGVLIFEIQQNSTSTYRLYDYMRRDKDGNLRELHIEKSLDVLAPSVYESQPFEFSENDTGKIIGKCKYFTVKEYDLEKSSTSVKVTPASFLSITAITKDSIIEIDGEKITIKKGETYFAPAPDCEFNIAFISGGTIITVEV